MTETVLVRDDAALRRLTLNRAQKINALDTAMMRSLAAGVQTAAAAGAEMIVVNGAGARGFCAGGDVAEMERGEAAFAAQEHALRLLMAALHESALPLICVVHGRTLGAGCILSSLSDIVLAADDLHFGFPEIHFGLYPAFVHGAIIERVTPAQAVQLCIGGRILNAADAMALGFVTEVLPAQGFAEAAERRIAYYHQRIDAVRMGRRISRLTMHPGMANRLEVLAPLLTENHGAASVQRLLHEASFARSTRGG